MLPNRWGSTGSYRYGFQGQERDDEIKGEGNSLNYKYRMHDPRIGRFFAVDPLMAKYPFYSPYQFSGNRVINAVEIEGLEPWRLAKYLVKIIFGKVDKAVAVDKIENADIYDETNQYNSRVLGYLTYDIFTDTLQFTDIDDAVIIGTTILPGETGPINVKGETATKTDQYFAFGGYLLQ